MLEEWLSYIMDTLRSILPPIIRGHATIPVPPPVPIEFHHIENPQRQQSKQKGDLSHHEKKSISNDTAFLSELRNVLKRRAPVGENKEWVGSVINGQEGSDGAERTEGHGPGTSS